MQEKKLKTEPVLQGPLTSCLRPLPWSLPTGYSHDFLGKRTRWAVAITTSLQALSHVSDTPLGRMARLHSSVSCRSLHNGLGRTVNACKWQVPPGAGEQLSLHLAVPGVPLCCLKRLLQKAWLSLCGTRLLFIRDSIGMDFPPVMCPLLNPILLFFHRSLFHSIFSFYVTFFHLQSSGLKWYFCF